MLGVDLMWEMGVSDDRAQAPPPFGQASLPPFDCRASWPGELSPPVTKDFTPQIGALGQPCCAPLVRIGALFRVMHRANPG